VAIEVRSPDDTPAELREKCAFYVAHGVAEAWLLDPVARTAEVSRAPGERVEVTGDGVLVSPVLPGFSVPLADLFAVLDRE
jgi:Uma2 family endonuclease